MDRPYYKGDEELILYAREYSRDCENKEYRRLARKGLLEETLQKTADECRACADELINRGTFPPQAWHWAIRVNILHADMD